jgi:hypothetical protein
MPARHRKLVPLVHKSAHEGPAQREPKRGAVIPHQDALASLAKQINTYHEAAETAYQDALSHAMACGDSLIEAKAKVKEKVGHGNWLPWLRENCPVISERTVRLYMQLARNRATIEAKSATVADLRLSGSLKLLSPPREKPKAEPNPEIIAAVLAAPAVAAEVIHPHVADWQERRIVDAVAQHAELENVRCLHCGAQRRYWAPDYVGPISSSVSRKNPTKGNPTKRHIDDVVERAVARSAQGRKS